VILAPAIRIEPLADTRTLRRALEHVERYRWIVFTSQNAVHVVCGRLAEWSLDGATLGRAPVAAIGPATAAALRRSGVTPALVPEAFVAEAVVRALAARDSLRGARVLIPRALEARDALPEGLQAHGALVDVIPVYRTVREAGDGRALAAELVAGRIDVVTFTSSSTVRHFVGLVGSEAATSGTFAAAVIGPVTAATARALGVRVAVEADPYTVPALVAALARHFA